MREAGVSFRYDAPEPSAREFADAFALLLRDRPARLDAYTLGGTVEVFEQACARLLGKEKAVFMPTGTLANHLAVRALAQGRSRVLVQEQGHLFNDSGDCLQRLSGFNAVPLGHGRAGFTLEEVQGALRSAGSSRVRVDIGAIVLETPVRRQHGALFDQGELTRICAFARAQGIGLHLDGARIFIASAYTGIPVADYAAAFDTVYVSLYKYFGSPCGAVLAGPAALLEGIHHERRMFGGALNQAWMFAAAALANLDGFAERFGRAVAVSEDLKGRLRRLPGCSVSDIPQGTNVFRLHLAAGLDPAAFQARLAAAGILLPQPEADAFYLKVNESLLAMPAEALAGHFGVALDAARGGRHGWN